MQIEYTGRQTTVSDKLRKMAEKGSARIDKILGSAARCHIVLTSEKHRHIAEVEVKMRTSTLVALCESPLGMDVALREALSKAENQAVRYKKKRTSQKRLPKAEKALDVIPQRKARALRAKPPSGLAASSAAAVLTSPEPPLDEVHVIRTVGQAAVLPMTIEEAVKEAEYRDREVFVFRDYTGNVNVLHRQSSGKMELIEAPPVLEHPAGKTK